MKRKVEIVVVVEYEIPDEIIMKHAEDSGDDVLYFNRKVDESKLTADELEDNFNWFSGYDKLTLKVLDFKERTLD